MNNRYLNQATKTVRLVAIGIFFVQGLLISQKGVQIKQTINVEPSVFASCLFDSAGKVSAQALELLKACKLETDGTIRDIVAQTQKEWIRPASLERVDLTEKESLIENKAAILKALKACGFVDEVMPRSKNYDHALILGAYAPRIRARLAMFVEQWNAGVRCKQFVFLVGERPRRESVESVEVLSTSTFPSLPIRSDWKCDLNHLPTTETEIARYIYEQSVLPNELKKVPVIFISASLQKNADGSVRRPATIDTINTWVEYIKTQKKAAEIATITTQDCLVVSNQPYVLYQDLVVKSAVPLSFVVETIGKPAGENVLLVDYLDTVARAWYEEKKRLER